MNTAYYLHIDFTNGSNPWHSLPVYTEKELKKIIRKWTRNYEVVSERTELWLDGMISTTYLRLKEKVGA